MKLSSMAALALAVTPVIALAETAMPADVAAAYDHPRIVQAWEGRPIVVSPDDRSAVYTIKRSSNPPESQRGYFLANGSPQTSDGDILQLLDLRTHQSRDLCATSGNSWDPAFSPDGRYVAFYSDRTGQARLWEYDVANDHCRQVSDADVKSTYFPFEQPRWSPDGKTIYVSLWPSAGPGIAALATKPLLVGHAPEPGANGVTVFQHTPGGSGNAGMDQAEQSFERRCSYGTYLAASLAAINTRSGAPRILVRDEVASDPSRGNDRHHPSPYSAISASGKWISYYATGCSDPAHRFAQSVDLYIVSTAGGAPIRIAKGLRSPGGGVEFDWGYRWHPHDDAIVYLKDGQLWRVRISASGAFTTDQLGKEVGSLIPSLLRFTDDGAVIAGIGTVDDHKARPTALVRIPFDGMAPTTISVSDENLAIKEFPPTTSGTAWRNPKGLIVATAYDERSGSTDILGFDFTAGRFTTLWRGVATLDGPVPIASGLLTTYEDFSTPPDVTLISNDWRKRDALSHVAPGLDMLHPGRIEQFVSTIALGDGTTRDVRSSILLPPGAKRGEKLPAIVWFYPTMDYNPFTTRYGAPAMDDLAHLFTTRGYAVLLVDMPLGPGNEKGNVIDEIMDDLLPQVQHAISLGYVDPNRLALRGQSFGGFATVAVISRTNLFRAAIASSGLYDLGGVYGQSYFMGGELVDNIQWAEKAQPRLGGSIWDEPMRYIENSPYYHADHIHTPLLILQGTNDPIGFSEGPKLFVALRRLDRTVELALYDGGGHEPAAFRASEAQDQALRTITFLDEHLKGHVARAKPPGVGAP